MSSTRVTTLVEVSKKLKGGETLCLQQAIYDYGDGTKDLAFRFIKRGGDGKLKAQRGQAGIPDLDIAEGLIAEMRTKMLKTME